MGQKYDIEGMDKPTIQARIQKKHGLSDGALAKAVGVTKMTIGNWRRGLNKPTGVNLLRLLTELGHYEPELRIEDLLDEPVKPLSPEAEVFKGMADEVVK